MAVRIPSIRPSVRLLLVRAVWAHKPSHVCMHTVVIGLVVMVIMKRKQHDGTHTCMLAYPPDQSQRKKLARVHTRPVVRTPTDSVCASAHTWLCMHAAAMRAHLFFCFVSSKNPLKKPPRYRLVRYSVGRSYGTHNFFRIGTGSFAPSAAVLL